MVILPKNYFCLIQLISIKMLAISHAFFPPLFSYLFVYSQTLPRLSKLPGVYVLYVILCLTSLHNQILTFILRILLSHFITLRYAGAMFIKCFVLHWRRNSSKVCIGASGKSTVKICVYRCISTVSQMLCLRCSIVGNIS